jgi:tetratricopeptide (TPR) repeat protein
MALSFHGDSVGQAEAARSLKPDPDDKNVGPDELSALAEQRGVEAPVLVNGDVARLKRLLAAEVPVIIETWFVPEPNDEMGHYRLLVGYEEGPDGGLFHAYDSYHGPTVRIRFAELDAHWRVFNRTYLPVFRPAQREKVQAILGRDADVTAMYLAAAARAQEELAVDEDAFGWFNLGSSLVALGEHAEAAEAFDRARALGLPWRMLWYQFGPFEAYAAVERWDDVQALADTNLGNAQNLEESHFWRGRALAAKGDVDGATAAWKRAADLNPNFAPASEALSSIR